MNTVESYVPIVILMVLSLGFVALVLVLTHVLGPRLKGRNKNANFECGVESKGDARFPVSVKYFLIAILFVLFDVEVIFFYPYALNFKSLAAEGLLAVCMFVGFFLVGFFYVLKKGALEWDK